jgi:dienelactone hydrolase
VNVPSLDAPGGTAVVLAGQWFAAPGAEAAPAMLLLHGCGGLFDRDGKLAARYTGLAARLNAMGVHVLVTDSLRPRGERELCTQAAASRSLTQTQRRRDALGALQWLAGQRCVDAARMGLLGWSNGGSSVLAAINLRHREVADAPVRASLAVAYYPGCAAELRRGFSPAAPLLMLLGEADDWTPAAACKQLAAAANGTPAPQWASYPDAPHGFDGMAPVRLRRDVPNGVNPGQGVHVGANAAARDAAEERLNSFIRLTWKLPP